MVRLFLFSLMLLSFVRVDVKYYRDRPEWQINPASRYASWRGKTAPFVAAHSRLCRVVYYDQGQMLRPCPSLPRPSIASALGGFLYLTK